MGTSGEWMFISEVKVDFGLGATEKLDHWLTLIVGVLPSIDEVEYVVIRELKPLNLIRILIVSLHDSISSWFLLVEMENKVTLHALVDSEFHWQVWEDNIVLSNGEVMDHSNRADWDLHIVNKFSGFVEQRVVDEWGNDVVAESKEFTGLSVDFWVC